MKIALIGSTGLVGSALNQYFSAVSEIELTCLSRSDIEVGAYAGKYDIIINSNGSGNKTWCNLNPRESFEINCSSIYKYNSFYSADKYVLISSIDAGSTSDYSEDCTVDVSELHTYGMHKHFAELIVKQLYANHIILRLGGLLSESLTKNVAYDIKNNRPLFISRDSVVNFISTKEVAAITDCLMRKVNNTTINVAALTAMTVDDLIIACGREDNYRDQDSSSLGKVNYLIPTDRLQEFYNTKSTREYILEYMQDLA